MATDTTTTTIDITPDDDGYAAIAAMFANSIYGDATKARRDAVNVMLRQVIDIAFYLGNKGADPTLRATMKSRLPLPADPDLR